MQPVKIATDKIERKVTVAELIYELQKYPLEMQVAMSRDEEGNGFSASIEVAKDSNILVLWPGHMDEIDELADYEEEEDETS